MDSYSDDWSSGSDIDDKKKDPDFDIGIHTTGACADHTSNKNSTRVHPLVPETCRRSINPKPVIGLPEQMSNVHLQNGCGDTTRLQNPTYLTYQNNLNGSIIPQNILLTTFSVCEIDIKPGDNIGKTHDEVSNGKICTIESDLGYRLQTAETEKMSGITGSVVDDTKEKLHNDGTSIPSNSEKETSTLSLNREGTNKYSTALLNNLRSKTLPTLHTPTSQSEASQQNVETSSINKNYPRKEFKDRTPVNYLNSEKKYKCHLCDKSYTSSNHLKDHFERIHLYLRPHKCKTCGKRFYSKGNLKSHSATHNPPSFKCHICGFASSREQSIKLHIKAVHEKEKNEQCHVCGKIFFCKDSLNKHYKIHTGEKKHVCEVCGSGFARKGDLLKHIAIHTGKKDYVCDKCGKEFRLRNNLALHMNLHTKEKPYKCEVCGRCFAQMTTRNRHMVTHTKDKPYSCDVCHMKYSVRCSLNRHKKNAHH